jgi:hypothetical protein
VRGGDWNLNRNRSRGWGWGWGWAASGVRGSAESRREPRYGTPCESSLSALPPRMLMRPAPGEVGC